MNMNKQTEYDTEYCNVKYIEKDNVILLTWKKFAQCEDYRRPTLFALDLLKQNPKSNFVVDARNGFEDAQEDVEWGFNELLPNMSKTDCKYVVFIMEKVPIIEAEMDMWTKEFGKYFAVSKVESYDEAIEHLHNLILVNVKYTIIDGKRYEFLEKIKRLGIIKASKAEPGNFKYEYYLPVDSENDLFLLEMWVHADAIKIHGETEHYQKLQDLKKEYVAAVNIEKFYINSKI